MKMVPDLDRVFRAIPEIKERLQINIELASPDDFIPVREGWEDRSPFIAQEGLSDVPSFRPLRAGAFQDRARARARRG